MSKNKGEEWQDPMIPKECRGPLPKDRKGLSELRDRIYDRLPTIDVGSRAYTLLEKRIEQINLRLDQLSDKKGLSPVEIDKEEEASLLRGNIRFYLDVLNDKLKRSLLDESPVIGVFEQLAKQNHDALEQLLLHSDPLESEERKKLRAFLRFFKGIPPMSKEDFPVYKTHLEDLMMVFPKEKAK